MFEQCRYWRELMNLRADGLLTYRQRSELEEHLDICPLCQSASKADSALRRVSILPILQLSNVYSRRFDDRVLGALKGQPQSASEWFGYISHQCNLARIKSVRLDFDFITQLAGGALAAASVTVLILLSALVPGRSHPTTIEPSELSRLESEAPSFSQEKLIQSPQPSEAQLWTSPSRLHLKKPNQDESHNKTGGESNGGQISEPVQPRSPTDRKSHGQQPSTRIAG